MKRLKKHKLVKFVTHNIVGKTRILFFFYVGLSVYTCLYKTSYFVSSFVPLSRCCRRVFKFYIILFHS
jgi:hypothetical protein